MSVTKHHVTKEGLRGRNVLLSLKLLLRVTQHRSSSTVLHVHRTVEHYLNSLPVVVEGEGEGEGAAVVTLDLIVFMLHSVPWQQQE